MLATNREDKMDHAAANREKLEEIMPSDRLDRQTAAVTHLVASWLSGSVQDQSGQDVTGENLERFFMGFVQATAHKALLVEHTLSEAAPETMALGFELGDLKDTADEYGLRLNPESMKKKLIIFRTTTFSIHGTMESGRDSLKQNLFSR